MRLLTKPLLVIRADATPQTGAGHMMRCLALAQAWHDAEGHAVFLCGRGGASLRARIADEGCEVVMHQHPIGSQDDAYTTAAYLRERDAHWAVLDGYLFAERFQQTTAAAGVPLLLIEDDDQHDPRTVSLALRPAGSNADTPRALGDTAEILTGARHALLRREFLKYAQHRREPRAAALRVVLTLGAGQTAAMLAPLLHALVGALPNQSELMVIAGSGNCPASLRRLADSARAMVYFKENVCDIADWFAWADVAVSGAGATAWELAACRTPSVLITLADNQLANADTLADAGAALSLGTWAADRTPIAAAEAVCNLIRDHHQRRAMAAAAERYVDGLGAQRVVERMRALSRQRQGASA